MFSHGRFYDFFTLPILYMHKKIISWNQSHAKHGMGPPNTDVSAMT